MRSSFNRPRLNDYPSTRQHMLAEFDADVRDKIDYSSKYQTDDVEAAFTPLLRAAIQSHDDCVARRPVPRSAILE